MKKKGLIITIVIILILAIAGGITAFVLLNQEDDEDERTSSRKNKIEWGDTYLEVLKQDDEFEEMSDMELQLIDMDGDEVPELVVYGVNEVGNFLAKIYRINDKEKVDTVVVDLQDEFEIKFLYNVKDEVYGWYAVVKSAMPDLNHGSNNSGTDTSTFTVTEDVKVYDLNIATEKYEPIEIEGNFEENFVEVEMPEIETIPFKTGLEKEEIEEIFEEVKDNYVTEDDIVTEEVKEEVEKKAETARMLTGIPKMYGFNELVYSGVEIPAGTYDYGYKYPIINIDSEDVKRINSQIKQKYGFSQADYDQYGFVLGPENVKSSYFYQINGETLSLVVYNGGNESIWANAYNVNLKTLEEVTAEELLELKDLSKTKVIKELKEAAEERFDDVIANDKEKSSSESMWNQMYGDTVVAGWREDLLQQVDDFENLYLDENGDLCILLNINHAGGQWSCYMTHVFNISKDYEVKTLEDEFFELDGIDTPGTMPEKNDTKTTTTTTDASDSLTKYTLDSSVKAPVKEGVYEGPQGTLTITNAKDNQFDFSFECYKPNASGANIGMLDGTAQTIKGGNYVYHEYTGDGEYDFTYNIFFYIADGGIKVEDECLFNKDEKVTSLSPYCGNGVAFDGDYLIKK